MAIGMYGFVSSIFKPDFYKTPELYESSFWFKVMFAEIMVYHHKFKYYGAFGLGESICNASGLGFSGVDEDHNPTWDKLKTLRPLQIEYATNIRGYVDCWNLTVNVWLKKCVYSRLKVIPFLGTWVFSALWHGFYSGYYTFFIPLGYALFLTRKVRRTIRPYFLSSPSLKLFYDVITWFVTRLLLNFYAVGFATLNYAITFKFWNSASHYGTAILLLGTLLVIVFPTQQQKKDHNQNDQSPSISTNGHHQVTNGNHYNGSR